MTRNVLWLLSVFALVSPAQTLTFGPLPSAGSAPSPRVDGTIAYDPVGRQILMFGGQDNETRNDLWAYSLDRRQWSEVAVAGDRPAPRFGHTLIFDAARRRLILFGGQSRGFFSDVWAFDLAQGIWRMLAPEGAGPSRRYGHSAVYDTRGDQMVISHGFTNAGRFDDTWAFSLASNSWRDLSPSGTRPVRRCLHHAVIDEERSVMYLYGGCASGFGPCPLGDLWTFDLSANRWTEVAGGTRPAPREHYGFAFDSDRRRVVLFAGQGGALHNDTWEFDPNAGSWRQPELLGGPPRARSRLQGTFAGDRGAAFFFGGRTDTGSLTNELLMLAPAATTSGPQITREGIGNSFSGEAAPIAPGQIVSIYGSGLGPDEGMSAVFDSSGNLPVSLSGVAVSLNGIPAPLYFVRRDQINAQVPYELNGSPSARLQVTVNGQTAAAIELAVSATRAGLFPRVWNQTGSENSAQNPAAAGEILVLYATGQGVTVPATPTGASPRNDVYPQPVAPVTLTVGGLPAEILFRGQAPGTVGAMQINARVPAGVTPGPAAVVLTIGDRRSQAGMTVAIR